MIFPADGQRHLSAFQSAGSLPPGTPKWVTATLIEKTQQVWGKRAKRSISTEEALEIILQVGKLVAVLSGKQGGGL